MSQREVAGAINGVVGKPSWPASARTGRLVERILAALSPCLPAATSRRRLLWERGRRLNPGQLERALAPFKPFGIRGPIERTPVRVWTGNANRHLSLFLREVSAVGALAS